MMLPRIWIFHIVSILLINCVCGDVLVLGSGGLIGSELTRQLLDRGYRVVQVTGRRHVDLRNRTQFIEFISGKEIDFVFFLACEVGGAKFIESGDHNVQMEIIQSNLNMYSVVFDWIREKQIPFLFTSSSLQSKRNAYGVIKRLGEVYIEALGIGKSVRLWNIFGKEEFGPRSRVITDWIHGCLHENKISALTDGMEFRQFMYSVDCASGLITMMEMYNDLTPVTDLSTNQWTQIRDLAHLIATLSPQQNCSVEFSSVRANLDRSDPPNLSSPLYSKGWAPIHTLENAISELYAYYSNSSSCLSEPNHTYSSSDK